MPSPAEPTNKSKVLTPLRSTSTVLAASPGFITPLLKSVLPSAMTRNSTLPGLPTLAAIDADLGRKPARSAVQLNVEDALGVRSHAMLEGLSADRQRFAGDRLVDFRFAPALLHLVQIERAEGDGFFRSKKR